MSKKQGFTLIETLIAISILTIALTGPLAIIAQALRSSYYARDEITAYYLAQEAVEYIRNERDIVGLQGIDSPSADSWLQGVATDPNDPGTSLINPLEATGESSQIKAALIRTSSGYELERCVTECPVIKYNTSFFSDIGVPTAFAMYGDEGGDADSIFTREIVFSEPPPYNDPGNPDPNITPPKNREVIITVRVKWTSPAGNSSVSIREHLTNWQLEKIQDTGEIGA